jgi:probable rRNA maturation factor
MAINVTAQGVKLPLTRQKIAQAAAEFLLRRGVKSAELSIVFLPPAMMRELNNKHLQHDHVTDVVTFNFSDGRSFDGEIYICPAEALRNAKLFGETFERELLRYLAHGILHLLGHDDGDERQQLAMRREEDRLLALWP